MTRKVQKRLLVSRDHYAEGKCFTETVTVVCTDYIIDELGMLNIYDNGRQLGVYRDYNSALWEVTP